MSVILVIFVCIFLLSTKFDIASSSIFLLCSFCIVSSSSIYFFGRDGFHINIITIMIVLICCLLFCLSERLGYILVKRTENSSLGIVPSYKVQIWKGWFVMLFLVGLVAIYGQVNHLMGAAAMFSKDDGFSDIGQAGRLCAVNPDLCHDISIPIYLNVTLLITKSAAYFYTMIYMLLLMQSQKYDNSNVKYTFQTMGMVSIYLVQMVLSTNRTGFIYFFIFVFTCWLVLGIIYNNQNRKKNATIVLKRAVVWFLLCSTLFYILGLVTGKSQSATFLDVLMGYNGLQIYALNAFLVDECAGTCSSLGHENFIPMQGFLNSIGIYDSYSRPNLPFFSNNEYTTNVYTGIRRVVSDFSYAGVLVYFSVFGFLYGGIYGLLVKRKLSLYVMFIYAFIMYPIFMMGWEEKLTNSLFTTANVFVISFSLFLLSRTTSKYKQHI
ncbi:oligosaccharide repeat unit polymerase [Vibrio vulnificus]|nr:oligosaccharide repeat unit polymerase [Vibrio vulnificus]